MYQRYDSVQAVLRSHIDPKYQSFLAEPLYNPTEDTIDWYVDKWEEHPRRLVDLTGEKRTHYKQLMDEAVQHYRQCVMNLENEDLMIMGGVLKYVSEEMVYCYDNKVVMICWGMKYDVNKHNDMGSLIQEYVPAPPVICQVVFNPGEGGTLQGNGIVNVQAGTRITAEMVPTVSTRSDYVFTGWDSNPIGEEVTTDRVFTAQYDKKAIPPPPIAPPPPAPEPPKPQFYNVMFTDGGYGVLNGNTQYRVPAGAPITANMIPQVSPKRGYKFTGWDVNPLNFAVQGDRVFTARYEKKKKSVWSWLWWVLLLLLLLLLLIFLLWQCDGCDRPNPNPVPPKKDTVKREVVEEPVVPSTGDVEITVYWHSLLDVDLACVEPSGEKIYHDNLYSRSGGQLEIDMNYMRRHDANNPLEHIYWPEGAAPRGTYEVLVRVGSEPEDGVSPQASYELKIKYGEVEKHYRGTVAYGGDERHYTFTY